MSERDSHYTFYAPWPHYGKRLSAQWQESRLNSESINPIVSFSAIYDKDDDHRKESRIRGWEYGDRGFHNRYRTLSDSDQKWKVQVNTGTEDSPTWVSIFTLGQNLEVENFYLTSFIDVRESDGDPEFRTGKLDFNSDDFYLTSTPENTPIVNLLQKFLKAVKVDDNSLFFNANRISFNGNEFYLTIGSTGHPVVHLIPEPISDGVTFDNAVPYFFKDVEFSSSVEWVVKHNFNLRPVHVEAYSSNYRKIEVHEVDISDPSTTYFYFTAPTAGHAVIGAYPPDSAIVFEFPASLTWAAEHNLNKLIGATTFDSEYRRIQPHEVDVSDNNTTYFYFLTPTAGYAVINRFKGARTFNFGTSVEWVVNHNFGQVPVTGHLYNSANRRIYPQSFNVNDPNIAYFYFLAPTAGYALIEAGVELCDCTGGGGGVTDHGDLTGLGDDDHTQYSLVNGTRPFTGTVGGVYPTASSHLATKQYVDDSIAAIPPIGGGFYGVIFKQTDGGPVFRNDTVSFNADSFYLTADSIGKPIVNFRGSTGGGGVTDHGALTGLGDDDHTQYLLVDGTRNATGNFTFEKDVNVDKDLEVKGSFYLDGILDVQGRAFFRDFPTIFLGESPGALFINSGIDNNYSSSVILQDQGSSIWEIRKDSTNNYQVSDVQNVQLPFTIEQGAGDNLLVLKSTRKVGIGQNSPTAKLHVRGNVRADQFIGGGFYFTDGTGEAIAGLRIRENDSSPNVFPVRSIVVPNSSLTDLGNGEVSLSAFGTSDFISLSDTPVNYTGAANTILVVNAAGTAVQFVNDVLQRTTFSSDTVGQLRVRPATTSATISAVDYWTAATFSLHAARAGYNAGNGNFEISGVGATNAIIKANVNGPADAMVITAAGNTGLNTASANAAALLHMESTTKGFLPPRLTNAQMYAVSSPPQGLKIYNTDAQGEYEYNGNFWLPTGFPRNVTRLQEDWIGLVTTAAGYNARGWSSTAVGTLIGVATGAPRVGLASFSRNNNTGAWVWDLGGTAAGNHAWSTDNIYYVRMVVRIDTTLADREFQFGWGNWASSDLVAATIAIANGAYFEFVPGTSANWGTNVRSASSGTTSFSSTAVAVDTWYTLEIVHIPGTSIRFYLNGTLLRTVTTGLPSDTGDAAIWFRSRSTTSSARVISFDYHEAISRPISRS